MSGYFQPVSIAGPKGAEVSLAIGGQFTEAEALPVSVGMLIAPVYRLRVTNIPFHPGIEVFPTVEVIDRLYPPPGQAARFPIPVLFSQDELEMAIEGKYVTRVIYLEDPLQALPASEEAGTQNWFEAELGEDPLAVADRLGRPVAIVRIGGRLPAAEGPDDQFLAGSPPLTRLTSIDPLGATAGLSSSAVRTVGPANRGTRQFKIDGTRESPRTEDPTPLPSSVLTTKTWQTTNGTNLHE